MVRGSEQKVSIVVVVSNSIDANFKFAEICIVFVCLKMFLFDRAFAIWCLSIRFSLWCSSSSCMSQIYAVQVFFPAQLCSHGLKFIKYGV